MQPFGKLAVLLAAVGVGTVPSAFAFDSSWSIAQQVSAPVQRLRVPSTFINSSPKSPQKIKFKPGNSKNKVKNSYNQKPPARIYPIQPKPKTNNQRPPARIYPIQPKPKTNNQRPPARIYPIQPKPKTNNQRPPITTFPENLKSVKSQRRSYLALQKPTLLCRSFKRNEAFVRGFKVRLYGKNISSVASLLKSNLNAYQGSGGNLSRCNYTGLLSPLAFKKYFENRKPTLLIRSSDNYSFPVYSSYSELFSASGGRRSRFGLIATTPSFIGSKGRQEMLKITVNNALLLFVDGRNQSVFKASSSRLPLRLIKISPELSEVLSDASQSSLRRIIDFKKRKRSTGKHSFTLDRREDFWQASFLDHFSSRELQKAGLLSGPDGLNIASLDSSLLGIFGSRSVLLAEVDPQIAEYCLNAQDFSGCVETMQESSDAAYPGSEDSNFEGDELEGEYVEIEFDEDEFEYEFTEGEFDEDDFGAEFDDGVFDEDEFDDGSGMYPEDMGAPIAQSCNGETFGEQLACALISALSTLLQQAFASN